mmetsp:Transcript_118522/g.331884  ORF Transcript_118522/g.331884 Transcript_118522/m.331884 type:complete len:183 (+) Transcript_118522:179-727(+)
MLQARPPSTQEIHGPGEEDSALSSQMFLDDQRCECSTVFLTTVLDLGYSAIHARQDAGLMQSFSYFQKYYESTLALPGDRTKAVILHSRLPENLTRAKSNPTVSFVKVDLSVMDKHLTVVARTSSCATTLACLSTSTRARSSPASRPITGLGIGWCNVTSGSWAAHIKLGTRRISSRSSCRS